jgi:deoxycytidine triphosphate deaminase
MVTQHSDTRGEDSTNAEKISQNAEPVGSSAPSEPNEHIAEPTNKPVAEPSPQELPVDKLRVENTTSPVLQETGQGVGSPAQRRWGVLVRDEIKGLNLIRLPEPQHSDDRCYQPTSYDLRLGAEFVVPHQDGQLAISRCDKNGSVTIPPFATTIVSTYEFVALPNNVVGRFNLRIHHALEGLMVQMGTQVEPNYDGPLFALLHNISNQPKTLRFRDYDTRPFTIEFSYTSQPSDLPDERKKSKGRELKDFVPPNYARGGLNLVLKSLQDLQKDLNAKKMLIFTGIFLIIIILAASILIPIMLTKFSYDRDYFPLVSAEAIAAMKYGPNHSNDSEIVKEVIKELQSPSGGEIAPRDQFYAERLRQLKTRRDSIKGNPAQAEELKSIQKQIDEIVELLRK